MHSPRMKTTEWSRPAPSSSDDQSAPEHIPAGEEHDCALLRRVAARDEAALGILFDRWSERVHAVAFYILNDEDEAEDVVEDTFWQVWRTAAAYDGTRATASTWLMMIARCRALDRLRSLKRRSHWMTAPSTARALGDTGAIFPSDPSEGTFDAEERGTRLASVLRFLPDEQRSTLEMAYFEGLSHSEIARRMDLPLGTVKTRIRLAMQKLREAYRATPEPEK